MHIYLFTHPKPPLYSPLLIAKLATMIYPFTYHTQAYRLLVAEQYRLGWRYPIHLGVTEAGEGEDGRVKSAIGIGALLSDGIGDTIRVSLTEDPWLELGPCTKLAAYGMEKSSKKRAEEDKVPFFEETTRDFQVFSRREVALPCQIESDPVDVRGYMHRDGSVFIPITIRQLRNPYKLYKALGAKLSVGMPIKDIATVDSIVLNEVPPLEDKAARLTIKRLQEVGDEIMFTYVCFTH
jgi:(E)-4-hydroxy-3-methylbut-2-enyl-diphosphate synthase